MRVLSCHLALLMLCLSGGVLFCAVAAPSPRGPLKLDLRRLHKLDTGVDQWEQLTNHVQWAPSRTAAVICDMWDQHWCKSTTARVGELAPRINQVISELRRRGVLIIHCP